MWFIIQWLNRAEDGFHRVQGDLLLRTIKDPWEIEQIELLEKEEPDDLSDNERYFQNSLQGDYRQVQLGNNHKFEGMVSKVLNNDTRTDPRVVAKTGKKEDKKRTRERVRITHQEHSHVERSSKRKKLRETAMQRRGEDGSWGGDD